MARLSASIPSPPRTGARRTHLVVPHQGEPIAPAHRGETFAMRPCLFRMSPRPRAQGRDIGRPTQPTAYGPSPCARGRDATNNQAGRQPAPRPRAQGRDYIDLGRFVRPPPRPCARGRDSHSAANQPRRSPSPLCAGARPWENTEKRRGGHVVRCWPLRPSGRPA